MNHLLRIALPFVVLAAGIAIGVLLMATGPEVERRPPAQMLPVVETLIVEPQTFPVVIRSQGTVAPRTQSSLIPEVAGRIVAVGDSFRNGGAFKSGEVLFRIAAVDYENAVVIARADLARAQLALAQEKAQAQHALEDWQKLGRQEAPTDLTLHKPQVAAAEAEVAAAEARLRQAQINLARTEVRAPYAGRVLEKKVDVGQYVAPGTVSATLYALDAAEVRLPLTDRQRALLRLPETGHQAPVSFTHRVGGTVHRWQGRLVRSDGAIDTASQQLFVVAQIDRPFARHGAMPALTIGQFVEAEIQGESLENVFVLPRPAVEVGDTVLVIDAQKHIQRRPVQVVLRRGEQVVVSGGLQAGERISLTPMPFARDGSAVDIVGEPKPNREYPPLPVLEH